jgi:hypothetical protein
MSCLCMGRSFQRLGLLILFLRRRRISQADPE